MKVYVFGNPDVPEDKTSLDVAEVLKENTKEIEFVFVKPNEDLPFANENRVVIMDVVRGLKKTELFEIGSMDKLILPPRTSAHDFDLGFQLKYLKKLGKLKEVQIIGIPYGKNPDYLSIQSILRKLVAHDMQGS